MKTMESLQKNGNKRIYRYHLLAIAAICLFSLYYFVLQSQTYNIGDNTRINFLVEPKLLEFYKHSPQVIPQNVFGYPASLEMDIAFVHSPTFILLLRVLNSLTGNTIVSIKLLVLPKLLIYLFGMYFLLYYLTKKHYPSVLFSLLSIVPRFMPDGYWGIGPVFASEPKCFVYIFLPLIILLFLKYRNDLQKMYFLYLIIGCLGNIHSASALNIVLMLSFTQLCIKDKFTDRFRFAILPLLCAAIGVFPYMVGHLYKISQLQRTMGLGINLGAVIQKVDSIGKVDSIRSCLSLLRFIRPFFNLNTLLFLLPIGYVSFRKNYKDLNIKKILTLQFLYTFFFFLLCLLYVLLGLPMGGLVVYIGRTGTFIYLFIFIFVTFAFIRITDLVIDWIRKWAFLKTAISIYLTKTLLAFLFILFIYSPFGIKPNKFFPSYNFKKQLEEIRDFTSEGFVVGAVDRHFTDMANYINKLPLETTFTTTYFDDLIYIARRPTYELPAEAVKVYNQLMLYDNFVDGSDGKSFFRRFYRQYIRPQCFFI